MRPGVSDEPVMMRWMQLEIARINDGLVTEKKTLSDLMEDNAPASRTKSGKEYRFDRSALREFSKNVPEELRKALRVPITFYFDSGVPDSAFLTDERALTAFQALGDLSKLRTMRDGRAWVGRAIVYALLRKYPSLVQISVR